MSEGKREKEKRFRKELSEARGGKVSEQFPSIIEGPMIWRNKSMELSFSPSSSTSLGG
jgi:hypothetical protein